MTRDRRMRARRASTAAVGLLTALLVIGCGGSAKQNAAVRAERQAAIRRAEHPSFPVPPCSLLSTRQVATALGVRVVAQQTRSGCVYSGNTSAHDRRTLIVTPGTQPASGHLISPAIRNPVTVIGSGYRARVGASTPPGNIRAPATAVAGLAAGHLYVALLVEDANPDAPSQLHRATALVQQVGQHLHDRREPPRGGRSFDRTRRAS